MCGWPSLQGGEATAGDLLAMEAVADMLATVDIEVDVATNGAFPDGVDLRTVLPDAYDHLIFACGPLHGERIASLAQRFSESRRVAVGVSAVDPKVAALFDVVIARDGDGAGRPDLSFMRAVAPVPVIGVVRAHAQPEYGVTEHERVHGLVRLALEDRPSATVDFDTRVHPAADPFEAHARSSEAVSALAARMDAVVSTRLHGCVLSLAKGTPVVAIDPVPGGAKVAAQMSTIGWPCTFSADDVTTQRLAEGIEWCLTPEARDAARGIAAALEPHLDALRDELLHAVGAAGPERRVG